MEMSAEHFMPILFKVLFGFVFLNIIVNLVLLYVNHKRLYKLLSIFWPIVLFVFIIQASFQSGELKITMAYSATLLSVTVISMIAFEAIGRRFPLKKYIFYYSLFFPMTLILSQLGYRFTIVAMPFAIATATPLLHTFINIHFIDRLKTTRMQKVLGVVFFLQSVHCINFALFRMDLGAQLWGWLVTYAIFDMLAVLLPSIALEEANMSENERLSKLVDDRTAKLNASLLENEKLLMVLLHDISNPLMAMKGYLSFIKPNSSLDEANLEKVKKSQDALAEILAEVRGLYTNNGNNKKMLLKEVQLEECVNEVTFIFSQPLKEKNITLIFKNNLTPGSMVLADKASLTHSVISNLVSNALKFSSTNSEIILMAKEVAGLIVFEVIDRGPGIPHEVIETVNGNHGTSISSQGTAGEKGLGFGLSIVKSFVDSYGGQIEFKSKPQLIFPQDHGTTISITLEKANTNSFRI